MIAFSDADPREQLVKGLQNFGAELAGWGKAAPFQTLIAEPPTHEERANAALRNVLKDAPFSILQLITAHDGSLAEALSRAIVARANEIGLQVLCAPQLQDSPKGEKK